MRAVENIRSPFSSCRLTDGASLMAGIVGNDDDPPAAPAGKAFLTLGEPPVHQFFRAARERA